MKLKDACSWKKNYKQPRQHIKKQRHYFANKGPSSQSYGFSSSHVWMWGLDYKESWVSKNWCFWTVMLKKTLESPLECKESKPVHLKGNQSWIFIGRTDAEAETPIVWSPDAKNWLIWKDSDAGKDWMQKEKGMTEDKTVEWHHWLNGREFQEAPGVGDEYGNLVCCNPWGQKSQTRLCDWTELNWIYCHYYIVLTSGGFQGALVVKSPPISVGVIRQAGLISGLGRFPGGGHGNSL